MCLHCMPRKPRSLLEWLCDFAVVETLGRNVQNDDLPLVGAEEEWRALDGESAEAVS